MCGIVGYIGYKSVDQVLLKSLSRLEYRGYDSSGVASVTKGSLSVLKDSGKLAVLKELLEKIPLTGHLGIGHTRWATHGVPSKRNAHPHIDSTQSIAVVHNGIIENHAELRKKLEKEGVHFQSDTDTEVLPHLISYYHIKKGNTLEEAIRETLKVIKGSYAFCVISIKEEGTLIAARNGSPLVLGLGKNENFIASDAPAILDYTQDVIFLEDYQMAVVKKDSIKISTIAGDKIKPKIVHLEWRSDDASKNGFDHYMLKEIEEQPQVIERIIRTRLDGDLETSLFDEMRFPAAELGQIKRILIQACGTSWHSGLVAKFLIEDIAGIPTEVDVSSEFRYRHLLIQKNTLILSITQSGETIDTLMGLRRGKEAGLRTLSICNVLGSTIARESDAVIYTQAGPEIGVASTKAYTAQIVTLILLALYLGKLRNTYKGQELDHMVRELRKIPAKMRQVIKQKDAIKAVADKYFKARDFLFLARGINYPNAHEGALKIKEIAYIHATGHPAGEMKHGPIALIDNKMPVVAVATKSSVYEKMISNIQEVKARLGKVIAIATEKDENITGLADETLFVPETDEYLSPLLVCLPLQYLAYYVATLRGTDVDQPRNLAKSVTVE